jgi:hypothetical protein
MGIKSIGLPDPFVAGPQRRPDGLASLDEDAHNGGRRAFADLAGLFAFLKKQTFNKPSQQSKKGVYPMKHIQILLIVFTSVLLWLAVAVGLSYAKRRIIWPGVYSQGKLALNGEPVNAACNFQFSLYDTASLAARLELRRPKASA